MGSGGKTNDLQGRQWAIGGDGRGAGLVTMSGRGSVFLSPVTSLCPRGVPGQGDSYGSSFELPLEVLLVGR